MDRMKKKSVPWLCFAIIALMVFPLAGCGGGGDGWEEVQVQSQPPVNQPPADINVSRTQIAFGDVVADQSSDQTISVENTGSSTLTIGQIAKASSSPGPFSLLNDNCSLQSFGPGGTCTFQIRFSPSGDGVSNDVFRIPSNDPDAAENPVAVNVNGTGRSLYVSLNELNKNSCPRVKLLMNVNYKNSPLTGLTKTNLSLLENSAARTIETFGSYTEPISVALAMDYSDSMFNNNLIPTMQEAAKGFIDRMNPAIQDEAVIIKFSTTPTLINPPAFTTDRALLKTAIESSFPPGGNTALYDALWLALDETAKRANRKAVVVISDGGDNASTKTYAEVIAKAKGSPPIPIFTIGLGDADKTVLLQLANETGGQYYFAPTASDLNTIYLQIAEILVGQYTLEYSSQVTGTISLDVEVNFNGMTGKATKSFSGCP
jgi:VWFA-related protein